MTPTNNGPFPNVQDGFAHSSSDQSADIGSKEASMRGLKSFPRVSDGSNVNDDEAATARSEYVFTATDQLRHDLEIAPKEPIIHGAKRAGELAIANSHEHTGGTR